MNQKFLTTLRKVCSIYEIEFLICTGLLYIISISIWSYAGSKLGFFVLDYRVDTPATLLYIPPLIVALLLTAVLPIIRMAMKWANEPVCPHGKQLPFLISREDYKENFTSYEETALNEVRAVLKKRLPRNIKVAHDHRNELPLFNHICQQCLEQYIALQGRLSRMELENLRRIESLASMDPFKFESFIIDIFNRIGWEAQGTKKVADEGIDGILKDPKGERWLIQCKRYSKDIGPGTVRDFIGTLASNKVDNGMIITTSGFTSGACSAAIKSEKYIKLVDKNELIKLVNLAYPLDQSKPQVLSSITGL